MTRVLKFALFAASLMAGVSAFAAEHEGVSPSAEKLMGEHGLITNSMVTSWVVAVVVIILVRLAVRKPRLVPTRGQAVVEGFLQGVIDLTAPIVGQRVAKPVLPLLIALFTYILTQNWSGLFPGVGTVYVKGAGGSWMEFVRPGNADLNSTLALALVATACWFYFITRYAGLGFVVKDLFGNKADRAEVPAYIYFPLFAVFFAVGVIEVISILVRPISLSLRLFGNVFGGENLLHAMSSITRWGLPIPFYFLELLIGFVQALVFVLLVSVYIGLICNHGDDHGSDHGHGHEPAAH
ncbi:MAG TPA: F0F1 ATP synthase subunit A [Opitutaceae bacterium]|nr:F0F1 ATP synthase subunit A [Opitutaceae bacterium]